MYLLGLTVSSAPSLRWHAFDGSHPSLFLLPQRQLPQKQGRRSPRSIGRPRRIHAHTSTRTRTPCSRRPCAAVTRVALTPTSLGTAGRVEEAYYRLFSGLSADNDVFVRVHRKGRNCLLPKRKTKDHKEAVHFGGERSKNLLKAVYFGLYVYTGIR